MLSDVQINRLFCFSHNFNLDMGSTSIGIKIGKHDVVTFSMSFLDTDGYRYSYPFPENIFAKSLLL